MALNFPFEMFMQAMQAKRQNQDQMNQNISGIGQSLGGTLTDLGQQAEESRKQKIVQQLMQIMRQQGQPSQGPQLPGASQPGMPTPNSGMGSPPPNQSGNIMALMTQLDPAGAASSYMQQQDPLRQSEAQKNLAMAQFYSRRGIGGGGGKPTNPLDDAIKQKRLELMGLLVKKQKSGPTPKPFDPYRSAAIDISVQKANADNLPFWKKRPMITNPLKGAQAQGSPEAQSLSDDDLLKIALQGGDE